MPNPLAFSAGTTTVNSSHALRVSKMTLVCTSATAGTVTISDLNNNLLGMPIYIPGTVVGAEVTADYGRYPMIIPGGTNLTATNAIVTVTGAGAVCYVYHQ